MEYRFLFSNLNLVMEEIEGRTAPSPFSLAVWLLLEIFLCHTMAAAAPLEQQSIAQQLNVPEMMAETAATKATLDQYVAALHQKIEASEPSDAKEVAKPAAAAEAATTVQTLIDQRIVDKLDGYQAPPTPHMLASSQAQLEDRMKEANKKVCERSSLFLSFFIYFAAAAAMSVAATIIPSYNY